MTSLLEFEVRIREPDDLREAERRRGELEAVLLDAGAIEVEGVDVARPPAGRRAGELEIIGLLVSFAGTLAAAMQVLQGWQQKKARTEEGDTTLTLTIGDVTVTINDVPTPEEMNEIRSLLKGFDDRRDDDGN